KNTSSIEYVCMAVAVFILLWLAVYFVIYTSSHTTIVNEPVWMTNAPIEGKYAAIESITTHWVEKNEAYHPVAVITLDPSKSKSGSLRTLFRTNVGALADVSKVIGDSNTSKFESGLFENGESTITVQCTKGFANMSEFLGYKAQDDSRWQIEIREGKGGSRSASDFEKLAHAPIDPVIFDD
ncbi:MAG: hypothetical protein ABGY95_11850, partial [Rubritalea sp.]|uniref:hypothetical protein n=1 Tax=Rubritalea sp. TaxID=2109375 RepID=UPI0032423699